MHYTIRVKPGGPITLLAAHFGTRRHDVTILRGRTSRIKLIQVDA